MRHKGWNTGPFRVLMGDKVEPRREFIKTRTTAAQIVWLATTGFSDTGFDFRLVYQPERARPGITPMWFIATITLPPKTLNLVSDRSPQAVFLPQYWRPSYGFSAARATRSMLPPMIFRMSSSE